MAQASVVDYDAWKRGYMPPSEHILIHELSHEGARVALHSSVSPQHQMWVVLKGPALTNQQRKFLREFVNLWFEDQPETSEAVPKTVTE